MGRGGGNSAVLLLVHRVALLTRQSVPCELVFSFYTGYGNTSTTRSAVSGTIVQGACLIIGPTDFISMACDPSHPARQCLIFAAVVACVFLGENDSMTALDSKDKRITYNAL